MDPSSRPGKEVIRHYRVVRYFPHSGQGLLEEVLGENRTFEQARQLALREAPLVEGEDIAILDQNKIGLEAEVASIRGRNGVLS